jgi:hypothetical protein
MTDPESPDPDRNLAPTPAEPISTWTFSLASMFLFTTLTAFVLGMILWERGLGVALLIVSLPALLRTAQIVNRRKAKGIVMSFGGKVVVFCQSLALVSIIAGTAGGAFVAIGYAIVTSSSADGASLVLGGVLAIAVGGSIGAVLIAMFWRPRE